MSAHLKNIDKLEQLRKRAEKEKQEKVYAARLAAIEEQRAAKARSGGIPLLAIGLIFIILIVGTVYMFVGAPKRAEPNLLLNQVTMLTVAERVKGYPGVLDFKIFQKEVNPKVLKMVIFVDFMNTIEDGKEIGDGVMAQLASSGGEQGVGSAQYDYIVVISLPSNKQLTLGRMENGARSITWHRM